MAHISPLFSLGTICLIASVLESHVQNAQACNQAHSRLDARRLSVNMIPTRLPLNPS